jgi:hypothetical protein
VTAPLTVACVWVRGEHPYGPEYVARLHRMVTRHLARPFAFACLTDRPADLEARGIPGAVAVTKLPGFAPWTKLRLFDPARAWPGRVLYLDLDVLIVAPLDPIVDAPAPFAITDDRKHRRHGNDAFGRAIVRRFNSSVMAWDGGTQTELFTRWAPPVAQRLSGDQDWIGERAPQAHALPRAWFPRLSELDPERPQLREAKVVLAKRPKNAEAAERWPWVREAWCD